MRFLHDLRRVGPVASLSAASAGLYFFAGVPMARALGPSERGLVAVVVAAGGMVAVFSALGTNVAIRAQLPRGGLTNLTGFFVASFLLLGGAAIPLLVLAGLLSGIVVDPRLGSLNWLLVFVTYGVGVFLAFQSKEALSAVGLIANGSLVNLVGALVFVAAIVAFAGTSQLSAGTAIASYTASSLIQAGLAVALLVGRMRGGPATGIFHVIRAGPAYLGYHFGQELVFRFDRYLLGIFASSPVVGVFTVAASLAEVLRLPVLASGQFALFEAATGAISLRAAVRRSFQWMLMLGGCVVPLYVLAPWIVTTIYGPAYMGSVAPLRLLLVAQVLLVPFLVLSRVLVGIGGRGMASVPGVVGLIVLVLGAFLLMPGGGATGAAVVCGASYLMMSVAAGVMLLRWRRTG